MKIRFLAALAVAAAAAFVAAGSAGAGGNSNCPDGILASGVYNNVVVNGTCTASGGVLIQGNLTINGNGVLDAQNTTINGNVQAWPGSVLSLTHVTIDHGVSASGAKSVVVT